MLKSLFYKSRRHIPRPVRHLVYRAGMFFGDEFALPVAQFGDATFPSVNATLRYLKEWGFRPQTIVDVGAFHGDWTRFIKELYPDAAVLMIEPQDRWRLQLQDVCSYYKDVSMQSALLGADDGADVEFVEMATGSSVFEEQSPVSRTRVAKQTTTLDTVLQAMPGWERISLLKLDVQGYELEVLKGASASLQACELVLVECSLIAVNRGCPLVGDVFGFMTARGFRLLDVCSLIRRKDNAVWQADLLFVSNTSALVPGATIDEKNW